MTAPLSGITEYIRATREADALKASAFQLATCFERMYAQVGAHIEEMAALCRNNGKLALEAQLPEAVVADIESSLALIRQIWPALSDQPFPELPDAAVVLEPVVDPPVEG